jgi:hypothetical protein
VIALLAITEPGGATVDEPGVVAVDGEGVTVLCADAAEEPPDEQALWRHEELLERLMADRPLLPVRFGTQVADSAAAAAAVAGRGAELRERLEHVRGAVELSVRVRDAEAAPPPAGEAPATTGAEYLRARTAGAAAAAAVHEALEPLARDARRLASAEPLRAAYLVDRDRVGAFAARVGALQEEHPRLAILCTGPWAPYSFAEAR